MDQVLAMGTDDVYEDTFSSCKARQGPEKLEEAYLMGAVRASMWSP